MSHYSSMMIDDWRLWRWWLMIRWLNRATWMTMMMIDDLMISRGLKLLLHRGCPNRCCGQMPYQGRADPWIKVEDVPGWQSEELICPGAKPCWCWCRKRRHVATWHISEQEKQERWEKNLELLKMKDQKGNATTYGTSSEASASRGADHGSAKHI